MQSSRFIEVDPGHSLVSARHWFVCHCPLNVNDAHTIVKIQRKSATAKQPIADLEPPYSELVTAPSLASLFATRS